MALLSDRNFEQDTKNGVCVVKFCSLWSMDSRAFEQQFRELSEEFRGSVKFMLSDVNANQMLAKKQGITVVPTVVIYVNGSPVERITGLTKRHLKERIAYFLKKTEGL